MIRYFRAFTVFLLSFAATAALAQNTATTSSPYSKYGLGLPSESLLPQTRAMGGIAAGINTINGYNNINMLNPASYSSMKLTVIDVGLYANFVSFSKTGVPDQTSSNFRLSHVAFGIPVTKKSALSFGLMPYTELGYKYTQTLSRGFGTGSPADTNQVNYTYSGDGGLSKGYIGYGIALNKHLSIGANVSYIFGNIKQYSSTEIPNLIGNFNSRQESSSSIGGVNYDYGAQYVIPFSDERRLTIGYAGSANSKINSQSSFIVSQYITDYSTNSENSATDTVVNKQNPKSKIQLPLMNRIGFTYQADRKFLFGADYSMRNWSSLNIDGVNQGLQNSSSLAIGGQITPNANSLHSYLAVVDYRLGAHFDKTYITLNNQNIKQYGVTFGVGLPLVPNGSSFYKVNFSGEIGQRGTVANALVKETYFNLHIGFTLNDKWFAKYKFD